jgi:hypothetical protein
MAVTNKTKNNCHGMHKEGKPCTVLAGIKLVQPCEKQYGGSSTIKNRTTV